MGMMELIDRRKAELAACLATLAAAQAAVTAWFKRRDISASKERVAGKAFDQALAEFRRAKVKLNEGTANEDQVKAAESKGLKLQAEHKQALGQVEALDEERRGLDQAVSNSSQSVGRAEQALWQSVFAAEVERVGGTIKAMVMELYGVQCKCATPGGAPVSFPQFLEELLGRKFASQTEYTLEALSFVPAVAERYGLEVQQ